MLTLFGVHQQRPARTCSQWRRQTHSCLWRKLGSKPQHWGVCPYSSPIYTMTHLAVRANLLWLQQSSLARSACCPWHHCCCTAHCLVIAVQITDWWCKHAHIPCVKSAPSVCSGVDRCDSSLLCTDGRDHVQCHHAGFEGIGCILP